MNRYLGEQTVTRKFLDNAISVTVNVNVIELLNAHALHIAKLQYRQSRDFTRNKGYVIKIFSIAKLTYTA